MQWAILLAGGTGVRTGYEIPKQYMEVQGKPLFAFSLKALGECDAIAGIVIVAAKEWRDYILKSCEQEWRKQVIFAEPGRNRQESIYHGLLRIQEETGKKQSDDQKLEESSGNCGLKLEGMASMQPGKLEEARCDYVLVHDAARPYLTDAMIRSYFAAVQDGDRKYDGVLPVLPMKDTIYFSEDGKAVSQRLPRERLFAGQAPEVFAFLPYLRANEALMPEAILEINGSSEVALAAGLSVRMVPGEEKNQKITTAFDLEEFGRQVQKGWSK